jgi:hypothetical protein
MANVSKSEMAAFQAWQAEQERAAKVAEVHYTVEESKKGNTMLSIHLPGCVGGQGGMLYCLGYKGRKEANGKAALAPKSVAQVLQELQEQIPDMIEEANRNGL